VRGREIHLIAGLTRLGYCTRHIAQEHSYVKDMWQRLTNPDMLVFLDVSYATTCQRRKLDWTKADWVSSNTACGMPGRRLICTWIRTNYRWNRCWSGWWSL